MPAGIENNQFAYNAADGIPWHGRGHKVDIDNIIAQGLDPGEYMLDIAGLSWEVSLQDVHVRRPNMENTMVIDPDTKAVVRNDTGQIFQYCTERYNPVQNKEIVNFFKEFCDAGHAKITTIGALHGGKKIWCQAKLSGGHDYKSADHKEGYIILATSHDGSIKTVGRPTNVWVVCQNTFGAAYKLVGGKLRKTKDKEEFRLSHKSKFDAAAQKEAKSIMGMSIESVEDFMEIEQALSKVSIDNAGREEYVRLLLGLNKDETKTLLDESIETTPVSYLDMAVNNAMVANSTKNVEKVPLTRVGRALIDAMLTSPGQWYSNRKDTLFGAFQGVLFNVDHEKGRNEDNRVDSSLFGPGAILKDKALNVAWDFAGLGTRTNP